MGRRGVEVCHNPLDLQAESILKYMETYNEQAMQNITEFQLNYLQCPKAQG